MAKNDDKSITETGASSLDSFLTKVAQTPLRATSGGGRLMFAMDATASREPSWDQASKIQGDMFQQTNALGNLQVQLVYYRGYNEFQSSAWCSSGAQLLTSMAGVSCQAGSTQIVKVLRHAIMETKKTPIHALVFIGDCMEENIEELAELAGQLGLLGVPVFIFHEGGDRLAHLAFQHIAKLTRGACCPFDSSSPGLLRDLLTAVAVYAVGGRKALRDFSRNKSQTVQRLTHQLE